jgi:hypothetical protein
MILFAQAIQQQPAVAVVVGLLDKETAAMAVLAVVVLNLLALAQVEFQHRILIQEKVLDLQVAMAMEQQEPVAAVAVLMPLE